MGKEFLPEDGSLQALIEGMVTSNNFSRTFNRTIKLVEKLDHCCACEAYVHKSTGQLAWSPNQRLVQEYDPGRGTTAPFRFEAHANRYSQSDNWIDFTQIQLIPSCSFHEMLREFDTGYFEGEAKSIRMKSRTYRLLPVFGLATLPVDRNGYVALFQHQHTICSNSVKDLDVTTNVNSDLIEAITSDRGPPSDNVARLSIPGLMESSFLTYKTNTDSMIKFQGEHSSMLQS